MTYEKVTILGTERYGSKPSGTYRWNCDVHGRSFATFRTATEAMEGYDQHIEREHG